MFQPHRRSPSGPLVMCEAHLGTVQQIAVLFQTEHYCENVASMDAVDFIPVMRTRGNLLSSSTGRFSLCHSHMSRLLVAARCIGFECVVVTVQAVANSFCVM